MGLFSCCTYIVNSRDKKTTYRVYGVWMAQTKKMINNPPFELAIKAVRVLIREVKRRIASDLLPLDNPADYFNGVISNMIDHWLESEMNRYADNWEQAMIEDGSAFEKCEHSTNMFDWLTNEEDDEILFEWTVNKDNGISENTHFEAERQKVLAKLLG